MTLDLKQMVLPSLNQKKSKSYQTENCLTIPKVIIVFNLSCQGYQDQNDNPKKVSQRSTNLVMIVKLCPCEIVAKHSSVKETL